MSHSLLGFQNVVFPQSCKDRTDVGQLVSVCLPGGGLQVLTMGELGCWSMLSPPHKQHNACLYFRLEISDYFGLPFL